MKHSATNPAGPTRVYDRWHRRLLLEVPEPSLAGQDLRNRNLRGANLTGLHIVYEVLSTMGLVALWATAEYIWQTSRESQPVDWAFFLFLFVVFQIMVWGVWLYSPFMLRSLRIGIFCLAVLRVVLDLWLRQVERNPANLWSPWLLPLVVTCAVLFPVGLSELRRALQAGLDLRKAQLSGSRLEGALLYGAYLCDATLDGASLDGCNLDAARLTGASLRGVDLRRVNLWTAQLNGADLTSANLTRAFLTQKNLRGTRLDNAKLREAALQHSQLHGASLKNADLRGAKLVRAELVEACLRGADLRDANLSYTHLDADLTGAIYNDGTRWPKGFDVSSTGAIFRSTAEDAQT